MTARFHPGHQAAATPDKPAIVMSDGSGSLTYAELEAMANRISRLFRSIGLGPGDHVALVVTNRLEFLPVVWGARYAGLYYTAISTRLMPHEVAYIVDDCGAAALVVDAALPELAADLGEHLPDRREHHWVLGGEAPGYHSLEHAIAGHADEPLDDRPTGSDMLYSSGTTGRPKGV
ncbi:MAG: AMP-binding protein, partial [Acidimicrobiia bacterium]